MERDDLVASLVAHIRREEGQSETAEGRTEAFRAAQLLSEMVEPSAEDASAYHILGWFHWFRASTEAAGEGRETLNTAVSHFVQSYVYGSDNIPAPLLPYVSHNAVRELGKFVSAVFADQAEYVQGALDLSRRILRDIEANPEVRHMLMLLRIGLLRQAWQLTGDAAARDESISCAREESRTLPQGSREYLQTIYHLSAALISRFESSNSPADVDEAVALLRRVADIPDAMHVPGAALNDLALSLRYRFELSGRRADVDESIEIYRRAMAVVEPAQFPGILSGISVALRQRFEHFGDESDLDAAVAAAEDALGRGDPNASDRHILLVALGAALDVRQLETGSVRDLEGAITAFRQALESVPRQSIYRKACLANVSTALRSRFLRLGSRADLDESIRVGLESVATAGSDEVTFSQGLGSFGNLTLAFLDRYQLTGAVTDLDRAIEFGRKDVAARVTESPGWAGAMSNLCSSLLARFDETGHRTDLDEAIEAGRAATSTAGSDHHLPWRSANLAAALARRHDKFATGDDDIDEAVEIIRRAFSLVRPDHSWYARLLYSLGNLLSARERDNDDPSGLEEIIGIYQRARGMAPAGHPDHGTISRALGLTYERRFTLTGDDDDRTRARECYTDVAMSPTNSATERIDAATNAAVLAAGGDDARAADLFELAARLLPEVAPRRMAVGDQQRLLGRYFGLAGDAAASVLEASRPAATRAAAARALGLLEMGRGVVLSQQLDTRTDLRDLAERNAPLAQRFTDLRDLLDSDTDPVNAAATRARAEGAVSLDRPALADAFQRVVLEIRSQPGFGDFLMPPEPQWLAELAQDGPIAVINVSGRRSDALLVAPAGVECVQLPDLNWERTIEKANDLYRALRATHDGGLTLDQRRAAQDRIHDVLEWLWDAIAQPVLDGLGYGGTSDNQAARRRLWWVPTGLLAVLPLHAAGYHRADSAATVMDRAVSSYTPTVRALGHAGQRLALSSADLSSALVVAMPSTPGIDAPLAYASREADAVASQFPRSTRLIEAEPYVEGRAPTKANVLKHLGDHDVAHFACHAAGNSADPSQGRMFLHDHLDDPFTVSSLNLVRLERSRLAYLSACSTAFNSAQQLMDESLHMATAFQLAGFPHVIGTLWEINDMFAARIAEDFYRNLTADGGPPSPARALHKAIRRLRNERPALPALWASHIHAGA